MTCARIEVNFLDWWHAGTGRSGGGDADRISHRDEWGCPAMPMTQIMGILRETAEMRAGWDQEKVARYFGERTAIGEHSEKPAHLRTGGLVYSGDLSLAPGEQGFFQADRAKRSQLFGLQHATAMDEATGTAKDKSLRMIEAAVPAKLSAIIAWQGKDMPEDWVEQVDLLCALSPAFGALVRDGYGRAIACCMSESGE